VSVVGSAVQVLSFCHLMMNAATDRKTEVATADALTSSEKPSNLFIEAIEIHFQ
jgi:hypothetical protein